MSRRTKTAAGEPGAWMRVLVDEDSAPLLEALARLDVVEIVGDAEAPLPATGRQSQHDGTLDRLTPRERDVLALIAQGRSNAGIAATLVLSDSAVAKHINNIFTKLDIPPTDNDNRRVLAVLTYLHASGERLG